MIREGVPAFLLLLELLLSGCYAAVKGLLLGIVGRIE
jgi:hypothetical protein